MKEASEVIFAGTLLTFENPRERTESAGVMALAGQTGQARYIFQVEEAFRQKRARQKVEMPWLQFDELPAASF